MRNKTMHTKPLAIIVICLAILAVSTILYFNNNDALIGAPKTQIEDASKIKKTPFNSGNGHDKTQSNEGSRKTAEPIQENIGMQLSPNQIAEAKKEISVFMMGWEKAHAKELKVAPGAAEKSALTMYIPPIDAESNAKAKELLAKHGIPPAMQKSMLKEAGAISKYRYISYNVNPEDPTGTQDSMWIAYVSRMDSLTIDPLTGDMAIKPSSPDDDIATLPIKEGLARYSHLFSLSSEELPK